MTYVTQEVGVAYYINRRLCVSLRQRFFVDTNVSGEGKEVGQRGYKTLVSVRAGEIVRIWVKFKLLSSIVVAPDCGSVRVMIVRYGFSTN